MTTITVAAPARPRRDRTRRLDPRAVVGAGGRSRVREPRDRNGACQPGCGGTGTRAWPRRDVEACRAAARPTRQTLARARPGPWEVPNERLSPTDAATRRSKAAFLGLGVQLKRGGVGGGRTRRVLAAGVLGPCAAGRPAGSASARPAVARPTAAVREEVSPRRVDLNTRLKVILAAHEGSTQPRMAGPFACEVSPAGLGALGRRRDGGGRPDLPSLRSSDPRPRRGVTHADGAAESCVFCLPVTVSPSH